MIKGYVIEYNVRCIKTGYVFPDSIIPSSKFGDTFQDAMENAKVGDTSIAENVEGRRFDLDRYVTVTYDQMFVVTET